MCEMQFNHWRLDVMGSRHKVTSFNNSCATKCVGVKQTLQVGESGVDHGSNFHMVYCMGCETVLGKKYVASTPELDHLRGGFTFYVEKLNSYEVGSTAVPGSTGRDLTNKALDERIQKTQSMLENLERRLKEIEALVLSPSKRKSQLPCRTSQENALSECVETDSVSSTDVGAHSDGGMIQSDAGLRNYAGYSRAVTLQDSKNSAAMLTSDSEDSSKRFKRKRMA
ncbi:uncharacterized protein LOC127853182 isoform X2 [Dreissena polymorpha]|uniref:uncharacterized protein LOC127853182 isoform X2 n=1 Tax=Dreissena polymorpha TaxID=45954 RepID=UPI00226511BB|nr:uncharacterized protein LOC127853182 isoform X2 [Dreissena polymorpha]